MTEESTRLVGIEYDPTPGLKQSESSVDKAIGSSTLLQSTTIETLLDFSKMPRLGTVRVFLRSLAAVRSPMHRSSEYSRGRRLPSKRHRRWRKLMLFGCGNFPYSMSNADKRGRGNGDAILLE
jgi:hypothetical protein